MQKILIIGNGKIGTSVKVLLDYLSGKTRSMTIRDVSLVQKLASVKYEVVDYLALTKESDGESKFLDLLEEASIVINALPFFLCETVAQAAFNAYCSYIDFTEDHEAINKVYSIYSKDTSLTCAPGCGLAPGFVNYLGNFLSCSFDKPESLLMMVGALPKHINYSDNDIDGTYNLTWSVDGLVNEYLKPCHVRINGRSMHIPALSAVENVIMDGHRFEAACTSGGVGTLTEDLKHIPNVAYKTLRYPGHFAYVKDAVKRHSSSFDAIKEEFTKVYPYNDNDAVHVYITCTGEKDGRRVKNTHAATYYGHGSLGLSAIQTITAASATAVLELILSGRVSGLIRHKDINIIDFYNTASYLSFFTNYRR